MYNNNEYIELYAGNMIPLRVVVPCLVWVLHDYLVTLEDEIRYVWTQKRSFGKFMFFFIRYYTILLLAFDVVQIHTFAIKGVPNKALCVTMDPITKVIGALSLWAVEIVMQLRIYALFNRSKKVAAYNACFFAITIGLFIYLTILNTRRRLEMIEFALKYPLPGCPTINGGIQVWLLWIPATVFELNLFVLACYKSVRSSDVVRQKLNRRFPLLYVLLQDNILYFFGVACVLILNNLMTIKATGIRWLGFAPFHAAIGIMTARMHIHLRKFIVKMGNAQLDTIKSPVSVPAICFFHEDEDEDESFYSDADSDSLTCVERRPSCSPSLLTITTVHASSSSSSSSIVPCDPV